MLTKEAAKVIHDAREERGWTRSHVRRLTKSDGFEVSEDTIYNIEKGFRSPRKRSVFALARVLELPADDLFEAPATEAAS